MWTWGAYHLDICAWMPDSLQNQWDPWTCRQSKMLVKQIEHLQSIAIRLAQIQCISTIEDCNFAGYVKQAKLYVSCPFWQTYKVRCIPIFFKGIFWETTTRPFGVPYICWTHPSKIKLEASLWGFFVLAGLCKGLIPHAIILNTDWVSLVSLCTTYWLDVKSVQVWRVTQT